jgi:hypothetical protein
MNGVARKRQPKRRPAAPDQSVRFMNYSTMVAEAHHEIALPLRFLGSERGARWLMGSRYLGRNDEERSRRRQARPPLAHCRGWVRRRVSSIAAFNRRALTVDDACQ